MPALARVAAAFSAAKTDNGRVLGRSEVWDVGRLCQERGRAEGMAAKGEVRIWLDRLFGSDESKGDGDAGDSFSFVGEASDSGSMAVSDSWTERARGLPVVSSAGEGEERSTPSGGRMVLAMLAMLAMLARWWWLWWWPVGVFAGDDF